MQHTQNILKRCSKRINVYIYQLYNLLLKLWLNFCEETFEKHYQILDILTNMKLINNYLLRKMLWIFIQNFLIHTIIVSFINSTYILLQTKILISNYYTYKFEV